MSTFLDSEQAVIAKYGKAREHITLLRDKSTVLFGVDATELHNHSELKKKKFDVIIFMFPHTGVSIFAPAPGQSGPNPASIESNKTLMREFLKSAQHILAQDGEIHITLKTSVPYKFWTFPILRSMRLSPSPNSFNAQLFPDYPSVYKGPYELQEWHG